MEEWKKNNIKKVIAAGSELKNSLEERLMCAMTIAANGSMVKFQKGMSRLAIIGSV